MGAPDTDAAVLQAAAAIENSAVAAYAGALALPSISASVTIPFLTTFLDRTRAQHAVHARAFNAAAVTAGGRPTTAPDPVYAAAVNATLTQPVSTPADVVALGIAVEDIAAQTYARSATLVSTAALRMLFVSVAAVDAQHRAVLTIIQALMGAGAGSIALGADLAGLPAAVGSASGGAFYGTRAALDAG